MPDKDSLSKIKELIHKQEHIRNIGIIAHIDHGKSTLSDNLLAGAGMISEKLAGKQLFMDFEKQEQERGITIYSANASMVHEYKNQSYLINLIDTPGHVDFGGDVARAMRAVDGCLVVVCAVEGVMPQTEIVIKQALNERVRPVLFINKVDRLIKELVLTQEEMQKRFENIINEVNALIQKYSDEDFKNDWTVNVKNGSVSFGSAYNNWAISVPFMKETGVSFKDIINYIKDENEDELKKKSPLYKILLDAIIRHLPNPKCAQNYRIPKIWLGDQDSDIGKDMKNCNPDGRLSAVVTKVYPDPHAKFVAATRIFSGSLSEGQTVHLVSKHKDQRVQQVSIYKGQQRIKMKSVAPGNIVGLVGLPDVFSGETLCDPELIIQPFESIVHMFEPIVTKSIEPESTKELPNLIAFLRRAGKEDPGLITKINQDTGEYLVSGLGELHIESKIERKLKENNIKVKMGNPIVIYRETVKKNSEIIEGKSPNKHNKIYINVEPLEQKIYDSISNGTIKNGDFKKKNSILYSELKKCGMDASQNKNVIKVYNKNLLIDMTRGVQYLNEIYEMIKMAFCEIMNEGPLAKEPCSKIKVLIEDADLHDDPIHRGPAQIIPCVRNAIKQSMADSKITLLEPKQIIRIDVPIELMGNVIKEIQIRRGQILNMKEEKSTSIIKTKCPISEMFGFDARLKSITGGKGFYSLIDVTFEELPDDILENSIKGIKERKGLK